MYKDPGFLTSRSKDNIPGSITLQGLTGSAVYFPVASLVKGLQKIHVLILENSTQASYAAGDLSVLLGYEHVYLFPASYRGTGKTARQDESFQVQRTTALRAVSEYFRQPRDIILVSYPKALKEGIPEKESLDTGSLQISAGTTLSHQSIKEHLFQAGFEKTDFVSEPGQFAVRGSIVDVFSFSDNRPYRINFFGDHIENIRVFDQNSQLSIEERTSVMLTPQLRGAQYLLNEVADHALVWSFREEFSEIPANIPVMAFYDLMQEGPVVRYDTAPQPVCNKNFVLLVNDIRKRKEAGYRCTYLVKTRHKSGALKRYSKS